MSSIKAADKVKAWIQQVEDFEPLSEQTNRPSAPNQDANRPRPTANSGIEDSPGKEISSVMLSRSRQSGIRIIKSEPNPEATSFVTLSRSYVNSSPSRTPKRSVPTAAEGLQSTSQTPPTRFRKLKAKDKGKDPDNSPAHIKQESPDGSNHGDVEEESPLVELSNLKLSPQSEGSRSCFSSPRSPLFNESKQQQLSASIRFTAINAGATLSEAKSEDNNEPEPELEIKVIGDDIEQEQEQQREQEKEPDIKPFATLSEAWSHVRIDEATNWRAKPFRTLLPQSGPPCQGCHCPSSLHWVDGGNPNGNANRPYYRCLPCSAFTTWGDLRGVRSDNQLCDCGKPSRESFTGTKCLRGAGLVYWRCAQSRCQFFVWG